MSFSLFPDIDDCILPISAASREQAQLASDSQITPLAKEQAFYSNLGRQILRELLGHQLDLAIPEQSGLICPAAVEGVAIQFQEWKIVAITTGSIDGMELRIPQEWIDIPHWHGDYYIAIQVMPGAEQARILGYATHRQIKLDGAYDTFDRTYSLSTDDLLDWSIFLSTYAAYSDAQTRINIEQPQLLAQDTVDALIQRLTQPTVLLPRLELPFSQWAFLLNEPDIRHRLEAGWSLQQNPTLRRQSQPVFTRLGSWLQGQFDSTWQDLENLLPQRAIAARSRLSLPSESSEAPPSATTLYRAKELSLSIQQTLALAVAITPMENEQVQVGLTLETLVSEDLADSVQLRLLDNNNQELAKASAMTTESLTMRFLAEAGESFAVEIASQGRQVIEYFSV